jgi:hypothetical protein
MVSGRKTVKDGTPKGRPLAIDPMAQSASPTEPAFIAPPEGAPVHHGFVILEDVLADGFTLGKITDFEAEPCECESILSQWPRRNARKGRCGNHLLPARIR